MKAEKALPPAAGGSYKSAGRATGATHKPQTTPGEYAQIQYDTIGYDTIHQDGLDRAHVLAAALPTAHKLNGNWTRLEQAATVAGYLERRAGLL